MAAPSTAAFAAGTPPTTSSRSATPTAVARGRSTVVPFSRPTAGSTGDDEPGSLPGSLRVRGLLPRSLPSASLPSGGDSGSLRRPAWRPPAAPVPAPAAVVSHGFLPASSGGVAPARAAAAAPGGLLSRVLHVEGLHARVETDDADPAVDADALLAELQSHHPVFAAPPVARAFAVARVAHAGQAAPCGGPALAHAAAVARVVADLGADADAVAAALLHASLARGVATDAALAAVVDAPVLGLVRAVTRMTDLCLLRRYTAGDVADSDVSSGSSDEEEGKAGAARAATLLPSSSPSSSSSTSPARFIAMLVSMSDVRALVVKLAEAGVDLRARVAAGAGDTRAARAAARAALDVYAPLANRLGVWSLKASLEDAAFAVLHPAAAAALADAAAPAAAAARVSAVVDDVRAALDAAGLEGADVSGRAKNLYGLHAKMVAKGLPLDAVHDARAVRVIVASKADCYAAERAVHALWAPVEGRGKDYIRAPKANGYQSLHSVVVGPDGRPIEVQVRTRKMHLVAEFGVAAHWRYKEDAAAAGGAGAGDDAVTRDEHDDARVAWARWLTTWAHELDAGASRAGGSEGGAGLAALAGEVGARVHAGCTFPDHAPGCGFAAFLSRGLRAGAEAAGACDGGGACSGGHHTVLVAVLDHTAASAVGPTVDALPAGATGADVARARSAARGGGGRALRVLVNNGDRAPDAPLGPGDKVELFAAADAAASAPLTPRSLAAAARGRPSSASADGGAAALEDARARLDRLLAGPPATPERVRAV